jgi:hypothetical protein
MLGARTWSMRAACFDPCSLRPPAVLHPPLVPSPSWTAPARRACSAVSHVAFCPLDASSRTDLDAYISDYRDRGMRSVTHDYCPRPAFPPLAARLP